VHLSSVAGFDCVGFDRRFPVQSATDLNPSSRSRRTRLRPRCFLLAPSRSDLEPIRAVIASAIEQNGFRLNSARDLRLLSLGVGDAITSEIASSDLIIAIDPQVSPNVSYELGIAQAAGKPVILLVGDEASARGRGGVFFAGLDAIFYDASSPDGLDVLRHDLAKALADFRRNRNRLPSGRLLLRPATPPTVDLDRLHPRDAENLCFELLTQMGFRRIEWGQSLKEFDVVATLPKKIRTDLNIMSYGSSLLD
jgi:hypothetical protein